jgi:excisionase family DNA binding protein
MPGDRAPHDGAQELMTPDEVADLLRTTRRAIYAMCARGALPGAIRVGRRLLFRRVLLIAWLENLQNGARK